MPLLPTLLNAQCLHSLTIVRVAPGEWQASLELAVGTFRVRHAATPSEALLDVLGALAPPPPSAPMPLPPY